MKPSAVIDQFVVNVLAVLHGSSLKGRFRECDNRRRLERGPEIGADGLFNVEMIEGKQGRPFWGAGKTVRELTIVVRVAYWGGTVSSAIRDGNADMVRIADLCEDPLNYDDQVTGIRDVRSLGSSRPGADARVDLWETRFSVEWQQGGF